VQLALVSYPSMAKDEGVMIARKCSRSDVPNSKRIVHRIKFSESQELYKGVKGQLEKLYCI